MSTGGNLGGASFKVVADTRPFEAGMKKAQESARRTKQVLDSELGQAAARTRKHLDAAAKQSARFGQGLLQISNIVDDMQYGFRSVVNNLAPAITMFGGSAGLAAGVTVASVAINQLAQRWDQMMDLMRSAWLNVPADHLEKIRIRAEKAAEAFDKLMAAPNKLEQGQIDALADAMRGAPGGQAGVMKGVREAVGLDKTLRPRVGPEDAPGVTMRVAKMAAARAVMGEKALGLEEMKKKVVEEMMQERIAAKTKDIMGGALAPGAEGANSRSTLKRLLKQYPQLFDRGFRRKAEGIPDEGQDPDANKDAAKLLMGGRLGMQMMMGRAGNGLPPAPLDAAAARAMIAKNPFLRRFNRKMVDSMAKNLVGLTPDQARDVMGGMTQKKVEENAERFRDREGRPGVGAGAMDLLQKRAGAARKAGPGPDKPSPFEKAVKSTLEKAGIEGADAKGTVREMRKLQEDRVKAVMAEKGVTRQQAEYLVAQDQMRKRFPTQPSQWVGAAEFAKMSATGTLNNQGQLPDLARQQLKELQDIRQALTDMARKAGGGAAVAGP